MGAIIGGAAQIAGSLIGGKKRRRQAAAAQQTFQQKQNELEGFEFENQSKKLENVYEDATVNQGATNVGIAESDKALASVQQQLSQSGGGGSGSAAALVEGALGSKQNITGDIAAQEQQNQGSRLDAQSSIDTRVADEESQNQDRRFGQTKQSFGIAQGAKTAADSAVAADKNALIGGIGKIGGGITSAFTGGLGG